MKIVRLLFATLALTTTICTKAQVKNTMPQIVIVNGHFFREMPDKNVLLSSGTKIFVISTPNNTKAMGLKIDGDLPEATMRKSIPVEEIPEGTELLRRFNDAVANDKAATFSLVKGEPQLKAGDKFPTFSATDIDGKNWTNADIKGKVAVFNLWFTGCGPCRAEMPELSTWKEEMPEVMFFSSTYESPEIARPVLKSRKFTWIPLVNDTQFKKFIGHSGYPLTIIIDKEGTVVQAEYGTSSEQRSALKQKIQSLR